MTITERWPNYVNDGIGSYTNPSQLKSFSSFEDYYNSEAYKKRQGLYSVFDITINRWYSNSFMLSIHTEIGEAKIAKIDFDGTLEELRSLNEQYLNRNKNVAI